MKNTKENTKHFPDMGKQLELISNNDVRKFTVRLLDMIEYAIRTNESNPEQEHPEKGFVEPYLDCDFLFKSGLEDVNISNEYHLKIRSIAYVNPDKNHAYRYGICLIKVSSNDQYPLKVTFFNSLGMQSKREYLLKEVDTGFADDVIKLIREVNIRDKGQSMRNIHREIGIFGLK